MKRNEIITKLISEGFSERTLVNMNDKQLSLLSERIVTTTKALKTNPDLQVMAKSQDPNVPPIEVKETTLKGLSKPKKMEPKEEALPGLTIKGTTSPEKQTKEKVEDKETENSESNDNDTESKETPTGKKLSKREAFIEKMKNLKKNKKEINEWLGSLIENDYHCTTTKNEIMELIQTKLMEQHEAPVKEPATKPGKTVPEVEPGKGNPDRKSYPNPFKRPGKDPNPNPAPKFKHKGEYAEGVEVEPAPVKAPPKVDPGKTQPKPGYPDPFRRDNPKVNPRPKFKKKIPDFLSYKNIMSVNPSLKPSVNEDVKMLTDIVMKNLKNRKN